MAPRHASMRVGNESDRIGVIGPLVSRCWTLTLSVRLFRLIEEYNFDTILVILAIACANEIEFAVAARLVLI